MTSTDLLSDIIDILDRYHLTVEDTKRIYDAILTLSHEAFLRGKSFSTYNNLPPEKAALVRLIRRTQEGYLPKEVEQI